MGGQKRSGGTSKFSELLPRVTSQAGACAAPGQARLCCLSPQKDEPSLELTQTCPMGDIHGQALLLSTAAPAC